MGRLSAGCGRIVVAFDIVVLSITLYEGRWPRTATATPHDIVYHAPVCPCARRFDNGNYKTQQTTNYY